MDLYNAVIFDLDGTLLDTIQDLAAAANWVCRTNGWPQHTLEEYKRFVGDGIPKLVERFSPAEARTAPVQKKALEAFSRYYAAHKADATAPYPGIAAMLQTLREKGVNLGVLSNKEDKLADAVVRHYFDEGLFCHIQGARPGIPPKPDPASLLALLQTPGFRGRRVLYVGDSDVDILTAHRAGLPGCGVLWGFRGRDELQRAGADALAGDPHKLLEIILCG